MGNSQSDGESKVKVDEAPAADQAENKVADELPKLWMFGSRNAGCSTLYRQLCRLYGADGPSPSKADVYVYLRDILSFLLMAMEQLSATDPQAALTSQEARDAARIIQDQNVHDPNETLEAMKIVYNDIGLQHTLHLQRHRDPFYDSTHYFFHRIDQIIATDYCPTFEDILRTRVRLHSATQASVVRFHNQSIQLHDFNAHFHPDRTSRRIINSIADLIRCLVYVTSLTQYHHSGLSRDTQMVCDGVPDAVLPSRLHQTLDEFETYCNMPKLLPIPLVVIFNRQNLLAERLREYPLSDCFPDYNGGEDVVAATAFIQNKFRERNRNPQRQIHFYVVNALEADSVRQAFDSVLDLIQNPQ